MGKGTFNLSVGMILSILAVMAFMQAKGIDGALFMSIVLMIVGYDNFMQGFYEKYSYEEVKENI